MGGKSKKWSKCTKLCRQVSHARLFSLEPIGSSRGTKDQYLVGAIGLMQQTHALSTR